MVSRKNRFLSVILSVALVMTTHVGVYAIPQSTNLRLASTTSESISATIKAGITFKYNGKEQKPTIDQVEIKDTDTDADVTNQFYVDTSSYRNNKNASTGEKRGTFTVKPKEESAYKSSHTVYFDIMPIEASGLTINFSRDEWDFTGRKIEPDYTVYIGDNKLESSDYKLVGYNNNIEVGTSANVVIEGNNGNITGNTSKNFTIKETELDDTTASVKVEGTYVYTGEEIILDDDKVIVTVNSSKQTVPSERRTFTVSNNIETGEALVLVELKDGFKGNLTGKFKIDKYDLANVKIDSVEDQYLNLDDSPVMISVNAYYDSTESKKLAQGTDYKVSYLNNKHGTSKDMTEKETSIVIKYTLSPADGNTNFMGSKTGFFTLKKLPMDEKHVVVDMPSFTYDGTPKNTINKVTYKYVDYKYKKEDAVLSNSDYYVTFDNNVNAGTGSAVAKIHGNGIYGGTYAKKFTINQYDLGMLTVSASDVEYTGKETDTIEIDGLTRDVDYQINFGSSDLVNVGTVTAALVGIGNYKGKNSSYYKITPIDASKLTINGVEDFYYYTGKDIEPETTVTYGKTKLEEGIDYEVSYLNNKNPGDEATVKVTGLKRNIKEGSTVSTSFKIYKAELTTLNTSVSGLEKVELIDGKADPSFEVSCSGTTLTEGVDYTYEYDGDLTSAGVVKLKIMGKGIYRGTVTILFVVKEKDPDDLTDSKIVTTLSSNKIIYDGTEQTPKVSVKSSGNALTEGKDFVVRYADNVDVGTAIATVSGIGMYKGKVKLPFEIVERSIKEADFEYEKKFNYNTAPIEPDIELTYNGIMLRERLDYTVDYSDNIEPGKGKITVSGNGNFCDYKVLEFDIVNPYAVSDDSADKKDEEEKKDDKKSESNDDEEEDEDAENSEDVDNKVPESISSNVTEVQAAIMKNYGSIDDTVVLTHTGRRFVLTGLSGNDAVITVAKGNKFTIEDGMNGSFSSADNKTVSVSTKGVVKAKAASNGTKILFMNSSGETVGLTVKVIDPKIIASNKRAINLSVGGKIGVQVNVPLNAYVVDIKNNGVAKITNPSFNEAGKLEINGTAMHKGVVRMRLKIHNKKYTMKLRVK